MTIQTFRVQLTNNWWVGERMIFIFGQLGGGELEKRLVKWDRNPKDQGENKKMFELPPVI